MNWILTIIEPPQKPAYEQILTKLDLKVSLELKGRGTATKRLLDRLGVENKPKCVIFSAAGETSTQRLMQAVRRKLFIDAPGNGISVAVPIKSIGGTKTLEYMQGKDADYKTPAQSEYDTELILAIANEGFSDTVMDAAREAGARGGTILHAKGTAKGQEDKFYNFTLSDEKEMILIVTSTEDKAAIMRAILKQCGPSSEAGAITFSLPVSAAMGLSVRETNEE